MSTSTILRQLKSLQSSQGATVKWKGKDLINFCSNNYLGLKDHPLLKKRAIESIEKFGVGAGASRLVSGNFTYHEALENKLAKVMGYEAALLMNTGYQANVTLIQALADRDTLILMDRHCHNSLVQGALLSRAELKRFHHQDLTHLGFLLEQTKKEKILIITESIFSMDGDRTDLDALVVLAREYAAKVIVDHAHGVELIEHRGIDIVVGTFGKAFGCFGSYILCNKEMKELLIQKCFGLIYSTALPPMIVGAVDAAVDLLPKLDKERVHLTNLGNTLRVALKKKGYDIGTSTTYIIPIIVGDEENALSLEKQFYEAGVLAGAIRPPTVTASRVRLSLTALHTEEHLEKLLGAL